MEAGTAVPTGDGGSAKPLSPEQERDPRFKAAREEGQGEEGREMVAHAAMGAELTEKEEKSALDWLLGDPITIVHDIPVDVETPAGMRTVKFVARRIDPRRIDTIELRNVQQSTGRIDRLTSDMEIIAETCDELIDASGRSVRLNSDEFLMARARGARGEIETFTLASPALALERRFKGQEGVLTLVAAEIRRLAGYDPQRLGTSQRRLVEASLG